MIELIAQAVLFPVCVGAALLLLPSLAWCTQACARVPAWTAAPSLGVASIVSMWAVSGVELFSTPQRWQQLWWTAVIVTIGGGVHGLIASRASSATDVCPDPTHTRRRIILVATALLAVVVLGFPGMDSLTARVTLAGCAAILTWVATGAVHRAPIAAPLTITLAVWSLAGMLIMSGSSKMAFVASAVGAVALLIALLARINQSFTGGEATVMAGIVISLALADYACAYHADESVATAVWVAVAVVPFVLLAICIRLRIAAWISLLAAALLCGGALVHAFNVLDILERSESE